MAQALLPVPEAEASHEEDTGKSASVTYALRSAAKLGVVNAASKGRAGNSSG